MPNETAKRDFRQEVTDSIVEMLEKGTAPWQKPWDPQKAFELPFNPESDFADSINLRKDCSSRSFR